MKALSVAPLAAGAFVLCGVLLSFEVSAAPPGTIPPGAPRTLDLTAVPMTITQPGTYLVRRNWDLTSANPSGTSPGTTAITITANDVVIDFQGYQIKFADYGMGFKIKGSNVRLRNGWVIGGQFSHAIRSSGTGTVIDNMSIYTWAGVELSNTYAEVRDSELNGKAQPLIVGDYAVVERNLIMGNVGCCLLASNVRFERNRLQSGGDDVVTVRGNRNLLADNTVEFLSGSPTGGGGFNFAFGITGNGNALLRNTVRLNMRGAAFLVDGTANALDGNVWLPSEEGQEPTGSGILFRQGGNFYGNNRMWAQIPYNLGGMPQTDWGGNVGN